MESFPSSQDSAQTDQKPLLSVQNIKLSLSGHTGVVDILRGVTLPIEAGERVSIVGPSGSGKTTLLMVISGLQTPSSGAVDIDGQDITQMDEDTLAAFRRDNIGIVFQNFHLVPTMTALENVATPLEFAGDKNAMEKAKKALISVGLGHRIDHYPGQLSGGEQQRTALARALAPAPRLILADEPTGNLDHDTGEKIIAQIFELAETAGTTLVLVTHDMDLARRCDRIVKIADGEIIE